MGVSLTSTPIIYGLLSNSNQIQQNKQEFSKTNPLKVGKGNQGGKEDKKAEEVPDDEENPLDPKDPLNDDEYDFKDFMQKDDKIEIFNNKMKKSNGKIKKCKTKTKISNKFGNILNSNKENTNSENISIPTSKALNSFQNAKEKNEIHKLIKREETENTKELRKIFEQIQNYLPEYNLVNSSIFDSYFKKRDFLVSKTKQFLEHDSNASSNSDWTCEELLSKIKELSKEISMYYEMCGYKEQLTKISSSIQQYAYQLKEQHHKALPQNAAQLNETACGMQNDYYLSKMFSQVKNNILKSDIISSSDIDSCSNLENKNSKMIKDFQKGMEELEKKYSSCKKILDRKIKKLQADPNRGAPNPAVKDFIPQPKTIIIKKVPEN